jgi:hypothetical protein
MKKRGGGVVAKAAADEEGKQASPTDWSSLTPGTKVGAVLQELRVSLRALGCFSYKLCVCIVARCCRAQG